MSLAHQIMPAAEVRDLDLDPAVIRLDQAAQPREALNNDRIAEYAEAMKAGDQFPPLTVFHDCETYWLADGFHRHYAAQHAERKHIRCYVRQGGLRDAILWSVGANAKHGLARSDNDKERAVLRLLNDAEWSTWTDRDIAKRCHVSHPFVAKIRKGLTGSVSSERTYVTKHGTTARMKTAGINASRERATVRPDRRVEGTAPETSISTASEPKMEQEGTTLEADAIRAGHVTQYHVMQLRTAWTKANPEARSIFLAEFNLRQESSSHSSGGVDVDRSAERASSAVEVGATNSPDGAAVSASSGRPEGSERLQVLREPRNAAEPDAGQPECQEVEIERLIETSVTAGETALNSQSDDGAISGVKARSRLENAAGVESPSSGENLQEPTSSPAIADGPALPLASGSQFQDRPAKPLRPHCLKPDLCAGQGAKHCYACTKAMSEGEAA